MEDDIYRGMHIPKGSLVCHSLWVCEKRAFTHCFSGRSSEISGEHLFPMLRLNGHIEPLLFRAMTRDERIYPNASAFYPERFLEKADTATEKLRDPRNYIFGFGRRFVGTVDPQCFLIFSSENALVPTSSNPPFGS